MSSWKYNGDATVFSSQKIISLSEPKVMKLNREAIRLIMSMYDTGKMLCFLVKQAKNHNEYLVSSVFGESAIKKKQSNKTVA